jgi:uncharacterized protein YuzE
MKLNYYQDTDSLYIDLSPAVSSNSKEIGDGFVVDFDQAGRIVGIDIQQASEHLDSTNPSTTIL